MEEYLIRIYADRERDLIKIKASKFELRDGALIFYFLDETEGFKIARIIADGEWFEVIRAIDINGELA